MSAEAGDNQAQSIQISEYWAEQLKDMPYLSCKYISEPFSKLILFLLQSSPAR